MQQVRRVFEPAIHRSLIGQEAKGATVAEQLGWGFERDFEADRDGHG